MRQSTGVLNKWSVELTHLSQRSVAVSHSIIHIAVSYGNSTWCQKRGDGNSGNPVVPNSAAIGNGLFEGRRVCQMDPAIDELHLISRVESVKGSIDYRAEYPDLFHGLGKMEGPYKSALKDDDKPFTINVPRWVALPLMEKQRKS